MIDIKLETPTVGVNIPSFNKKISIGDSSVSVDDSFSFKIGIPKLPAPPSINLTPPVTNISKSIGPFEMELNTITESDSLNICKLLNPNNIANILSGNLPVKVAASISNTFSVSASHKISKIASLKAKINSQISLIKNSNNSISINASNSASFQLSLQKQIPQSLKRKIDIGLHFSSPDYVAKLVKSALGCMKIPYKATLAVGFNTSELTSYNNLLNKLTKTYTISF